MSDPLVDADDMVGFPGAPFPEGVLEAAAEGVRAAAGWHIAPVVEETLTLDHDGGRVLWIPTGKLLSVSEVRDVSGPVPRVLSGWSVSLRMGLLERRSWPCGFGAIEVDVEHGYEACPADLLPVIADATARRVRQQTAGLFSVTYATDSDEGSPYAAALARYRLAPRP